MEDEILFSVEDHAGTLMLNRPEVRNAFGDHTRKLLFDQLMIAENNRKVR